MNTYFVTEYDEFDGEVYTIRAETPELAVAAHADAMGYDNYDLELTTFTVYEPKVSVKRFTFDVTPRVVALKATKGDK